MAQPQKHVIFENQPINIPPQQQNNPVYQKIQSRESLRQQDNEEEKRQNNNFQKLAIEVPNPLLRIQAVFPLDLFPDQLIVDPVKITQIHKIFFSSEQIKSIQIKDAKYCILESGPIFSTLKIADNMLQPTTLEIKPLWKKEAIKAHDLIQGLMITTKQDVNTTKIRPEQQVPNLEQIGKPEV